MGVNYEYLEKPGGTFNVPTSYLKQLDQSRWRPTRGDARLDFEVYLNINYTLKDSSRPGKLRLLMMREEPDNETGYVDIPLLPGFGTQLWTHNGFKWWDDSDLGRHVHFEVKAYGTSRCYLTTRYTTYSQVW